MSHFFKKAQEYIEEAQFSELKSFCEKEIENHKKEAGFWKIYGVALAQEGGPRSAVIAFETAEELFTTPDSEVISNLMTCYLDDGKVEKATHLIEENIESLENEILYMVMDNLCEGIFAEIIKIEQLGDKTKDALFSHLEGEWDALKKSVAEVDGWSIVSDHPNNIFLQSVSNFQIELSQIDLRDFFISQGEENDTVLVLEFRNDVQMILTEEDIGISVMMNEEDMEELGDFPEMIGLKEIRNRLVEIGQELEASPSQELFKEIYLTLMMMRVTLDNLGFLGVKNLDAEKETVENLLLNISMNTLG